MRENDLSSENQIQFGDRSYSWSEVPLAVPPSKNWAHHGVIAVASGGFVTGVPSGNAFLKVGTRAEALSPPLPVTETHGMSYDDDGDPFSIWVADNGSKHLDLGHVALDSFEESGRVVRFSPEGELLQELPAAALPPEYRAWHPSSVVADHAGDDGRIWVADGYGLSLVHCYARSGDYLWTIDGSESGIRFVTPHALVIDPRGDVPLLLVADRGNRRLIWFTQDGAFVRSAGEEILTSPSGLAFDGDWLWVTELFGGVVVFDTDDEIIADYGDRNEPADAVWPNDAQESRIGRPTLKAGVFRSPHGIAIGTDGRVAITEWLMGGRLVILTPVAESAGGGAVN